MEAVGGNKKGFKLLRSSSNAVAHKTRIGFNLIEAAIVLAVVGGVIGWIWVAAATMIENYRVNKTVEDVLVIVRNVQKTISRSDLKIIVAQAGTDNAGLSDSFMIAASLYPADWVMNNQVRHPFGERSHIHLYDGSIERFDFYLYNLSHGVCVKLIVAISSRVALSRVSDWSSIGYIRVPSGAQPSVTYESFPIKPETANAMCDDQDSGSTNRLLLDATLTRNN